MSDEWEEYIQRLRELIQRPFHSNDIEFEILHYPKKPHHTEITVADPPVDALGPIPIHDEIMYIKPAGPKPTRASMLRIKEVAKKFLEDGGKITWPSFPVDLKAEGEIKYEWANEKPPASSLEFFSLSRLFQRTPVEFYNEVMGDPFDPEEGE